jgi:hypothetical protein
MVGGVLAHDLARRVCLANAMACVAHVAYVAGKRRSAQSATWRGQVGVSSLYKYKLE